MIANLLKLISLDHLLTLVELESVWVACCCPLQIGGDDSSGCTSSVRVGLSMVKGYDQWRICRQLRDFQYGNIKGKHYALVVGAVTEVGESLTGMVKTLLELWTISTGSK